MWLRCTSRSAAARVSHVLMLNYGLEYDDADLECIFTVICNLVSKAQSPDEALAMADQIANKLTAQPIEKPALCLKM